MNGTVKFLALAALACGLSATAPSAASAMPVAKAGLDVAPAAEPVHVVRVCNRWGRCWWTARGHSHRWGWGPRYRYGWGHPGWGWRGHRHWGWRRW